MYRSELGEILRGIAEKHFTSLGFELVELVCYRQGRDLAVRILADRPEGGITVDECARLNSQLSSVFEQEGVLQEAYTLEVSSPGLDRPLKTRNDFLRKKGKLVKIFVREPVEGKLEFEGVIEGADESGACLNLGDKTITVAFPLIAKAKQVITDI